MNHESIWPLSNDAHEIARCHFAGDFTSRVEGPCVKIVTRLEGDAIWNTVTVFPDGEAEPGSARSSFHTMAAKHATISMLRSMVRYLVTQCQP